MKKTLLLILALAVCSGITFAQSSKTFYRSSYDSRNNGTWDKSTKLLSFGLGFPNSAVGGYNGFGGSDSWTPPVYAKYEQGFLRDEVGLGGYISAGWGSYNNTYKTKISAFSIAVLGYYHFNKLIPVEKMDVYAGAGLSFRNVSYNYDDGSLSDDNDANVYFVIKVGIRYYIKPAFALYAESGYDNMSSINLGVSLRF